jgi:hypothetical protein
MLETDVGEIEERLQLPLREVSRGTYQGEESTYLPLSSWVHLCKLRQMEWIVQLGFELRVYQPDELAGMYYYLKRLASLRAQHTEHGKQTTTLREERLRQHLKLRKDDPLPPEPAGEFKRSKQHLRVTMLDAACTWEFADGLCLLYVVLVRLGLVKSPPRPYGTDALRYELRMRPFAGIAYPQLPSFDEFRQQTELSDVHTADVLRFAEAAVGAARKGFEACIHLDEHQAFSVNATAHARWVSNTKDCLRATIATGVALSTLKRAYESMMTSLGNGGKGKEKEKEADGLESTNHANLLKLKVEIPEPGDGYHDWWIVPKLIPMR